MDGKGKGKCGPIKGATSPRMSRAISAMKASNVRQTKDAIPRLRRLAGSKK